MRKIILIALTLLSALSSNAQLLKEFIQQKKTQREYLLKQIAALKVYIGYAQKGYRIAHDGLDFIGDVKSGEFSLHKDYFSSLKAINPVVKNYPKSRRILDLQQAILSKMIKTKGVLRNSRTLEDSETAYFNRVCARVLGDCTEQLDELDKVTSPAQLEMTDDQRIERIDELYERMRDNLLFTAGFCNEALQLSEARRREAKELKNSRIISGLNQEKR